jgi:hypothetical protein
MKNIIPIFFVLYLVFQDKANSQIILTRADGEKQIEINTTDKVKVVFETDKKFNGAYNFILRGKGKTTKYGKLMSYTDSSMIIKTGIFRKEITVLFDDVVSVNRFRPAIVLGTLLITSAGLVILVTSTSLVNAPAGIAVMAIGIIASGTTSDLCIYPYRKTNSDKWKIEVK